VLNTSEHLKTALESQKMMSVLNEEIILWEERRLKLNESQEKVNILKLELTQRETTIAQLTSQLNHTIETISILNSRHQELLEHMSVLKAELEEEKSQKVEFAELIAQQQEISKAKIESVESKYGSIKLINLGLEKRIFQLHSDLERFQENIAIGEGAEQNITKLDGGTAVDFADESGGNLDDL